MQQHLTNLFKQIPQRHTTPEYLHKVFPVVAPLFQRSLPEHSWQRLQELFVQAKANPNLLGWLHEKMAEHWAPDWPEINTNTLFTEAADVACQHSATEAAAGILVSMQAMIKRGVVESGHTPRLVEVACTCWPYHADHASNALLSVEDIPDPAIATSLADGINQEDEEDNKWKTLETIWRHFSERQTLEQREEMVIHVLKQELRSVKDKPDKALSTWFAAVDTEAIEAICHLLLVGSRLNDDQAHRLWERVKDVSQEFSQDFFLQVIPVVLGSEEMPKAKNSILNSENEVTDRFSTRDEKRSLADALLNALVSAPSLESKRGLATWMQRLDGQTSLQGLYEGNLEHTNEDLDILAEVFPGERKKLKKIRGKETEEEKAVQE